MKSFDIIAKRLPIFSFTLISVIISFILIAIVPFNKSIEFTGGVLFSVTSHSNSQDFHSFIKKTPDIFLTKIGDDKYLIKALKMDKIEDFSQRLSVVAQIDSSSVIAPSMTSTLLRKSLYAVIFSILAVFLYIFIRFNMYYGFGAVITIMHDVILSMAFIKIMHIEFGISTIAAILTVIGYSVNDTVIVYDKIRASLSSKCNFKERINQAINATLPRTIGTSLTTILAIIPIIFFTTGDIQKFCAIVVFGIVIGTISSIAVSSLFLLPFEAKILEILKIREQA